MPPQTSHWSTAGTTGHERGCPRASRKGEHASSVFCPTLPPPSKTCMFTTPLSLRTSNRAQLQPLCRLLLPSPSANAIFDTSHSYHSVYTAQLMAHTAAWCTPQQPGHLSKKMRFSRLQRGTYYFSIAGVPYTIRCTSHNKYTRPYTP